MKAIKNLSKKLNSTQRILLAVFAPTILFVIALPIAGQIGGWGIDDAFDLDDTWWFWLLLIGFIGYFEFNLFSTADN